MKKFMTIAALAALALGVASCGDDDPKEDLYSFFADSDLITKTVTGERFFDYEGSKLFFDINALSDTGYVQVIDTKFSQYQPFTVSFAMPELKAKYISRERFELTGEEYVPMEGMSYVVKNVYCNVNDALDMYYLTYSVETDHGVSQVYTYPSEILTTLANGNLNYADATDLYMEFDCELEDGGAYEGDVLLHNVQFSIGSNYSPKMTIRIPYDENVTITGTTTGYTVEGTGITGLYQQGTNEVPFDRSTIDNLKIVVNVVDKTYSIFFNCMGGSFSNEGDLYL